MKYAIEANKNGMSYADFFISRKELDIISGEGQKEKRYNRIRRMDINKGLKIAMWKSFYDDMTIGGKRIYF